MQWSKSNRFLLLLNFFLIVFWFGWWVWEFLGFTEYRFNSVKLVLLGLSLGALLLSSFLLLLRNFRRPSLHWPSLGYFYFVSGLGLILGLWLATQPVLQTLICIQPGSINCAHLGESFSYYFGYVWRDYFFQILAVSILLIGCLIWIGLSIFGLATRGRSQVVQRLLFLLMNGMILVASGAGLLSSLLNYWTARHIRPGRPRSSRKCSKSNPDWDSLQRGEYQSIAAFCELTVRLVDLGAPHELIHLSLQAASDEARHSQIMNQLKIKAQPHSLMSLATDSFLNGCLNEEAASHSLMQLRDSLDQEDRALLQNVIAEEGEHVELAWKIVRWALESLKKDGNQKAVKDLLKVFRAVVASESRADFLPAIPEANCRLADLKAALGTTST